jgi:hypothetical protein
VQQRIYAADINERPVIHQAAHRAAHGIAFPQFRVTLLLYGPLFFFENGAAIYDYILVLDIELGNPAADLLLRDAGRNARTPTSTLSPPLITSVTVPTIVAFSEKARSSDGQSVTRITLPRDSW